MAAWCCRALHRLAPLRIASLIPWCQRVQRAPLLTSMSGSAGKYIGRARHHRQAIGSSHRTT